MNGTATFCPLLINPGLYDRHNIINIIHDDNIFPGFQEQSYLAAFENFEHLKKHQSLVVIRETVNNEIQLFRHDFYSTKFDTFIVHDDNWLETSIEAVTNYPLRMNQYLLSFGILPYSYLYIPDEDPNPR